MPTFRFVSSAAPSVSLNGIGKRLDAAHHQVASDIKLARDQMTMHPRICTSCGSGCRVPGQEDCLARP